MTNKAKPTIKVYYANATGGAQHVRLAARTLIGAKREAGRWAGNHAVTVTRWGPGAIVAVAHRPVKGIWANV